MALSHSPDYIAIDKAFKEACSRLIECTSPDDKVPEVDLTTKTQELSAIAPDPEDISAAADVVTSEMRALIGDHLIKAKRRRRLLDLPSEIDRTYQLRLRRL